MTSCDYGLLTPFTLFSLFISCPTFDPKIFWCEVDELSHLLLKTSTQNQHPILLFILSSNYFSFPIYPYPYPRESHSQPLSRWFDLTWIELNYFTHSHSLTHQVNITWPAWKRRKHPSQGEGSILNLFSLRLVWLGRVKISHWLSIRLILLSRDYLDLPIACGLPLLAAQLTVHHLAYSKKICLSLALPP